MLENQTKDFTVVLHDGSKAPRFLKINKKLFKTTIFLIVLISFLSILLALIYTTYIQNKVERSKSAVPTEILRLKKELQNAQISLIDQKKLNDKLVEKINNPTKDELSINSLVPLTLGFKDLRSLKMASVENIISTSENNKDILKFDIYNNTKEDIRLSGHIYVFRYTKGKIDSYPSQEIDGYNLQNGESFTISKFRPTRIEFSDKIAGEQLYKIFVFSRSGDLLDFKIYEKKQ